MITFSVSDVAPCKNILPQTTLASALDARLGSVPEAFAAAQPTLVASTLHGLVGAVHHAFQDHYPLVLSPDDIWLCIAQGFAQHVDQNAEVLRDQLVSHAGKVEIIVIRDEFVRFYPNNDWPGCFSEFSDQIALHVGDKRELVVANFSTTTRVEKAASEIVFMAALKHYFNYTVVTRCGIPQVTLLGDVSDWTQIRQRVTALGEFGLEWWTTALLPVLDQFVAAANGQADRPFWQSIYKRDSSSGGPYISGWINTLFPYIEKRQSDGSTVLARNECVTTWQHAYDDPNGHGPSTRQFPSGLTVAPFLWKYLATDIAMQLVAGFVGVSQDAQTRSVRPTIGWAVRESPQA